MSELAWPLLVMMSGTAGSEDSSDDSDSELPLVNWSAESCDSDSGVRLADSGWTSAMRGCIGAGGSLCLRTLSVMVRHCLRLSNFALPLSSSMG